MQSMKSVNIAVIILFILGVILAFYILWVRGKAGGVSNTAGIKHLGVIMDGNRRWAKQRGLPSWEGHRQGAVALENTIAYCLAHRIPYLTVYAFSIENLKRSKEELDYLFNVLAYELNNKNLEKFKRQQVQISVIGDRSLFPSSLISLIDKAQEYTKDGAKLFLTILFCYGGKQELVRGVQKIVDKVRSGEISPDSIDEHTLHDNLWCSNLPELDLVIRTGGDKRLSNFLLFLLSYTELFFLDSYWPEITDQKLDAVIEEFKQRKRNFGA